MAKNLVIVESPHKAETIQKILGKNYTVIASNGHVRDLPKSQLGVDVNNDYEPKYITIRGKGDLLAALRKEVKKADKIYLATDPDREGEAISWHLVHALKLQEKDTQRITFNEITKKAVKDSLKSPRDIDMDLVNSQQTRRILDRMVGYTISPVIWVKIKRGLSAGRVQSAALRLICDREAEIDAFIPEEYWTIDAKFTNGSSKKKLVAAFYGKEGKKLKVTSKEQSDKILSELDGAEYKVSEIAKKERHRKSPLPFTTSSMQQDASKYLNFSSSKTMRIAQQLYEGVNVKGKGTIGLITYLRTDSTRISDEASEAARNYIEKSYGKQYVGYAKKEDKRTGKIQDAHEAIRPTDVTLSPVVIKDSLEKDQFRLYQLIWNRFVASQMADMLQEVTSVVIDANGYNFHMSAVKVLFEGFRSVYRNDDEEEAGGVIDGKLEEGDVLSLAELNGEQHFTQPPAHYTEAILLKTLDELGLGRPSTYAPTISTLLARRYIIKEKKSLFVSELGYAVNKLMSEAFPIITDRAFTANMESLLDNIEEGNIDWKEVVRNFYPDLDAAVKAAERDLEKVKISEEISDEKCDLCGRNMVIKYGPYGKFLACPGFPECKNTKPFFEKIDVKCPSCGKDLAKKRTKNGRLYYGCTAYPDCEFMSWQKPSDHKCPECGSFMLEKGKKLLCSNTACGCTRRVD